MNTPNSFQISGEEESALQKLFSKYLPYWPLFIVAAVLGVLVAWAYLKVSVPVYEATATLIIKDEKKGNEESKLMESLNQISSKKIVENETEVLQSRKLMQSVANNLDLYTPIAQKKTFKSVSAYFSSPVIVKAPIPDLLRTKKNIPLAYDSTTRMVVLNHQYKYPLDTTVTTPYGELSFESNKNYIPDSTKKELFLSIFSPQDMVPYLQENLKVEPAGKLSSIINLSYRDEIPERASDILNELIRSYRQSEINEKNLLAKNTLDFINQRLGIIVKDLDTIQKKVQYYKSGRNAVDISTQGQLYLQNVSANDQKLSDINTQISVLDQVEGFINRDKSGSVVPSTIGVTDPLLSEMLTKLNSLELDYEKGKATIGENNPKLLEIRDQINKLKPNILKNINSQQKGLYAMRDNINATNNSYNSILSEVPRKERQLIDITRDEQTKRSTYDFLLQKKEESEIALASSVADNRIVDNAETGSTPVSPKKKLVYAGVLIIFMGIVLSYITIKESLNGKVLYRKEIENHTKIQVIGEITLKKGKKPIVIESGKRSFIAEEFRKLRLSLSHIGIDENHKKILVTSSISGEGKSFVAANLAISMTLPGKRVVIIDTDLNQPTQAKIFNSEDNIGVTQFLQRKCNVAEIIRKVPAYPNLYLVTAGELPDDPTELLSNGRIEELIEYMNEMFDAVIIDTSPMELVTDGYLITNLCDATLYVIRHHYTPKILIKRLDANNKVNPIHNPAILFNGVKQRGYLASSYGYGYGYDYVYGKKKYYQNRASTKS